MDETKKHSDSGKSGQDAEYELIEAKLRFAKAVNSYEPLGIIKNNPLKSAGCAFCLGVALSFLRKNQVMALFAPTAIRVGTLLTRYALGIK